MRVGLGLITCDRYAYTARTIESVQQYCQPRSDWVGWWHADDASTDARILPLVQAAGFETIRHRHVRGGARALRQALLATAQAHGADWLLLLENDWTFVRPFPWALLTHLAETHPEVYCLRLYGAFKAAGRQHPCATRHLGLVGRPPVTWLPLTTAPEPAEVAGIHWGAPPSVTRVTELAALHAEPARGREAWTDHAEIRASGRLAGWSARPVENVVVHIGVQPTAAPASAPRPRSRSVAPPVPRYSLAWQAHRAWTRPHAAACFDRAVDRLGVPGSVLDVGCGDGALVQRIRRTVGVDTVGVDLSLPESTGSLRHADLRTPLRLGRQFEWVLCWEVAEHLPASAAAILVASLVRHLAPGGYLLFTAARPGQSGDGHIHCAPPTWWREKLTAAGLRWEAALSQTLGRTWLESAPRTPWYGRNLQVFRRPRRSTAMDWPAGLALTMRTADRRPGPNYVGGTVRRLLAQGIPPAEIHVCATAPTIGWLEAELAGCPPVRLHVPSSPRTPNENGLAQIACLGDPAAYAWILLLEDDLVFCADVAGSVWRWLRTHARVDRHVYRFFGFRLPRPAPHVRAYDFPLPGLCGSQAVALRGVDAADFLAWGTANLETWGGFRGNPRIAFDKLLAAWALTRWPGQPCLMSHPLFVKHIGLRSSIHARAIGNDALFAGEHWRYGRVA
jgi:SAM-dependent methyltransferase